MLRLKRTKDEIRFKLTFRQVKNKTKEKNQRCSWNFTIVDANLNKKTTQKMLTRNEKSEEVNFV